MNDSDERRRRWALLERELLRCSEAGDVFKWEELERRHPEFAAELRDFLAERRTAIDEQHVTIDHPSKPGSVSRGLHIRCPHCSNAVEILADTPYEEVGCLSCGSMFSLVDREEMTRDASTLKSIGRFELVARLGLGGFGTVWKARDKELDRVVAVKIPRKGALAPHEIEQFFREARAAAQLRHPNIVPVYEVGREGETLYIVCELVRGLELGDWISGQNLNSREIAELCRVVALALHHAHEAGIVHRDLKPSNIMIDRDGAPHLMDFGLAKRETGEIAVTVDGQILGTPAYMSPEQAEGKSRWTDRRTDIYSLGVVLFKLLTGELPFRGNAQMQVHQRITEDAPDPRKFNRNIPRDLATICLKCLERDPNRRFATAQIVADELGRYLDGAPIEARPVSRLERAARWARRKPWLAATLGLAAVLAIGGPAAALRIDWQRRRLEQENAKYNNLISQYADESKELVAKNAALARDLDVWNGQADPWNFWPVTVESGPRRQLLDDLYGARFRTVSKQLAQPGQAPWPTAVGHLALASLAAATQHPREAAGQFRAAERLLRPLADADPAEPAYQTALAQCCAGLARTTEDSDPAGAAKLLREASEIYAQLAAAEGAGGTDGAAGTGGAVADRVEVVEIEMRSALAEGAKSTEHVASAARVREQLKNEWPSEPLALYEVVRRLVQNAAAGAALPGLDSSEPAPVSESASSSEIGAAD